jgi:hypothetical protein
MMKSNSPIALFFLLILVGSGCKRESLSVVRVGYPTLEERVGLCEPEVAWLSDNPTAPTRFRLRGAESATYLLDTTIQGSSIFLSGLVQPGRRYVYEVSQGEDAFEQEFLMRSIGEQYIGRHKATMTYWDATLYNGLEGEAYIRLQETADGLRILLEETPEIPLPDLFALQPDGSDRFNAFYAAGDSILRTTAIFRCSPTIAEIVHLDNRAGDFKYWTIRTN